MTTLPWRGRCSSWYGALSHLKFVLNKSQVQRSRHQFHYTYMLQYQSRHHGGLSGCSSFQVAFSVLIPFPPQCSPPRGWGVQWTGGRSFSPKAYASLASAPIPSSFSINHFPDGSHPSSAPVAVQRHRIRKTYSQIIALIFANLEQVTFLC